LIKVSSLKKSFGPVTALRGISFQIEKGEFYGLLGPNGAGKSTTINIISTLLKPDEGSVHINGTDLYRDPQACKKMIGVVPQEIALYNELSALENLRFWGSLYDVPADVLKKKSEELISFLGLGDRKNDKVKTYSGGMKRRINIACALLHEPSVLFMDEPTVGVDPQSRNLIFEVVEELHKRGMTIIYTTHYMEEAQRMCDRIGIIDNGLIVAQGTLDELRKNSGLKESIEIQLAGGTSLPNEILKGFDWAQLKETNSVSLFSGNVLKDLPVVVQRLSDQNVDIQGVDIKKVDLEGIFLKLTGKTLRD
jgi:ABC-2 type transport system ATP-binding protein